MFIKPYDMRWEVVVQWLLRALNIVAFYNNWSKLPISPENHLFLLSESSEDEAVLCGKSPSLLNLHDVLL